MTRLLPERSSCTIACKNRRQDIENHCFRLIYSSIINQNNGHMSYILSKFCELVYATIVQSFLFTLFIFLQPYSWKMLCVEHVKMGITVHVLLNNAVDLNLYNTNGDNILRGACEKRHENKFSFFMNWCKPMRYV